MTILPSPLAQSTLGEKCALYLDHVSDHLPVFLHSLRPRLDPYLTYSTTTLRSVAQALPFDVDEQTTALGAALLLGLLTVVAMSWGNPFNNFWRRSPNYPPAAPQVRDDDYSYITPEYIVDPPSQPARYGAQYEAGAAENEPDIICLKHRGTIYPLHFRAYAIDDGLLTVGDLRHTAAAKMGASNPNQIRLLYKGNLLKDDARTCKAEGLKQHSQVLCVVSEAGSNTPSDLSDYDSAHADIPVIRPGSSSSLVDGDDAPGPANPPSKKKNNKKKKKKGGKRSEERLAPETLAPSPSLAPPRPTSAGHSAAPSPSPSMKTLKTPLDQVTALTEYLKRELIPLCDEYLADPPTDPKKREFEYRKLSETILAQVMLKADGIEPDGNETVRNARKALIREAQASLNRLDEVGRQPS
ncbi:uncharacterized protein N7473_000751 [Penicillium subrubescens]|uniref:BAG domain-containing protein n=1 Tax=Penicillium subrubescens TaxID=1316194 RepID=A0A1Q5T0V1_9EURO|nr:uncharacterized protein N7473_000751 [Penicillium subrubescens]KAJ5911448.1 hypothetical protein N7473_000751 [Penicillium subrubescens]OKO93820.1 hypothetical protein PENSUB_12099 [Penicillium subrubescens]